MCSICVSSRMFIFYKNIICLHKIQSTKALFICFPRKHLAGKPCNWKLKFNTLIYNERSNIENNSNNIF